MDTKGEFSAHKLHKTHSLRSKISSSIHIIMKILVNALISRPLNSLFNRKDQRNQYKKMQNLTIDLQVKKYKPLDIQRPALY